jgi:UDP-glucuronate decarboxylase
MGKRILVTGGAGFLGSHLCSALLEDGNEVICLDNFFTGSKSNIVNLLNNPYFELIRHDICFPIYLEIDQIYNLACPASPVSYQLDPIQTTKTNICGAINVLGIAKRLKIPVLQASTSEIYGDPSIHPQTENYWGNVNPIGARSCYDEGKRCAETLFFDYYRQLNLDIRVARIFNTYGPNMAIDDGRVISNFITQALNNEDITLYGDGNQTRSLCYVDDLISALIKLMNTPGVHQPVNLGNPSEISMLELANIVKSMTSSDANLIYKPLPEDDPKQRCPDISLARDLLGWNPATDLQSGLSKTIEYFRNQLSS